MNKYILILLLMGLLCPNAMLLAQKTQKNVKIAAFTAPYKTITVTIGQENFKYHISPKIKYVNESNKKITPTDINEGQRVILSYKIEHRTRVACKVKLLSKTKEGKSERLSEFTGVFEGLDGETAYIDGQKVQLSEKAEISCSKSKKCGCNSQITYINFSELQEGDFLTIKSPKRRNSIVYTDNARLCKNEYTDTDHKLIESVENSYDESSTRTVRPPSGIIVPPNSLRQGNIKIGNLNYKLLNNIHLQGYVNMVGNRILPDYAKKQAYQDKHKIFFRFYVIDSPIPNAFSFPNGMVFIHTGLLQIIENEAQLAAVLGHEIAHVTYEHSTDSYDRQERQQFLEATGLKDLGRGLIQDGTSMIKTQANLTSGTPQNNLINTVLDEVTQTSLTNISTLFEKGKETQADRVSLFYMYWAGYDVREAAKFWKIMARQTGEPTFQENLKTNTVVLLQTAALGLNKTTLHNVSSQSGNVLAKSYLETIYTSHPLAKKRLGDINNLLSTTYAVEDFSKALIGKADFDKYVSSVK